MVKEGRLDKARWKEGRAAAGQEPHNPWKKRYCQLTMRADGGGASLLYRQKANRRELGRVDLVGAQLWVRQAASQARPNQTLLLFAARTLNATGPIPGHAIAKALTAATE